MQGTKPTASELISRKGHRVFPESAGLQISWNQRHSNSSSSQNCHATSLNPCTQLTSCVSHCSTAIQVVTKNLVHCKRARSLEKLWVRPSPGTANVGLEVGSSSCLSCWRPPRVRCRRRRHGSCSRRRRRRLFRGRGLGTRAASRCRRRPSNEQQRSRRGLAGIGSLERTGEDPTVTITEVSFYRMYASSKLDRPRLHGYRASQCWFKKSTKQSQSVIT